MIYGSNPTLLSVNYVKPNKKKDIKECFEVVYKTEDGTIYKTEEPAEVDIFFVKPEYRDFNYNKPQERIERLYKEKCLISKIRYRIAEEIGPDGLAFIKQCYENNDFKALNRLYGWRYAFGCDFQPEYYFMKDWYDKYKLNKVTLSKSFLDIETDLIDYIPDLDKLQTSAYAPVNLVTLLLEESSECYTFILRPYEPSKIGYTDEDYKDRYAYYEKQLKSHKELMENTDEFVKDLNNSFDNTYGKIKYKLREYSEEIELIADLFRLINDKKPNFCLMWNMRFDIQYLLERIKVLGYNPLSIMTNNDFSNKKCFFYVDRSIFKMEKQSDHFYCSSYTQFICQMRLYAAIRKSQQMLKSVSLNAIGERELKDKKIEYPDETNIRYFPYIDWKRFIKYNIKDVLIQFGIEKKTNDVIKYYKRSHSNITPYNKIFKETYLLRNVREKYFEKDGWIQGNNINIIDMDESLWDQIPELDDDEDDEEGESTFKGAIMADPLMNANVGIPILGKASNVLFKNAMDFDMGAFYPSIKIACNMDPMTLLYKAEINNEQFISGEFSNKSLNTIYKEKDKNGDIRNIDITGEIVNTYATANILTFGYNFLNLPSVSELIRDVIKQLKK